jgi:hypothetical protein
MFSTTKDLLTQLGMWDGSSQQLVQPKLRDETEYQLFDFAINGKSVKELMRKTVRSFITKKVTWDRVLTVTDVRHATPKDWLDSHFVAVSGPIYVMYGDEWPDTTKPRQPQTRAPRPLHCVSIPGINFEYSPVEQQQLLNRQRKIPNHDATERMRCIWHHTLFGGARPNKRRPTSRLPSLFQRAKVRIAVLCAIGCGAFRPNDNAGGLTIVKTWAQTLADLLMSSTYGLECVFVTLPTFDTAKINFDTFQGVFHTHKKQLRVPVVLSEEHGMLSLADHLSRTLSPNTDKAVGILNPSDAIRGVQLRADMKPPPSSPPLPPSSPPSHPHII